MATAYLMTVANLKFNLDVITEGLSIRGGVAFQSSSDRYNYSTRSYKKAYYDYNMSEWNTLGADIDTNLSNSISGLYQYAINYTASLDYDRTIGRHAIQAHFFTDYMTEQNKSMSSSYPALGLAYYSHNMGLNAGYSYAGRYAINATLGITGSDVFPSNNRYAFLPSVSLSWNIANEAFFKNAKDKVQQLKIRASYGISGLDAFASDNYRYLYKDMMRKDGSIELLGNPNLKPEKRSEINIGLDALLWNQLSINFDYFKRETNNMLIPTGVRVPQVLGIPGDYKFENVGSMQNSGLELSVLWNGKFGDWTTLLGVQWSHSNNKVIDAGEVKYPEEYKYRNRINGYPLGQNFGYVTDGYINSLDELNDYCNISSEIGVARLGDFKYKDINEDGVINEKDLSPIGKGSLPTDLTTIRAGFGWKGLKVELMFAGVNGWFGQMSYSTETEANGIYNDLHKNAWTSERASSGKEITSPALSYDTKSISSLPNDWNIDNRSFWRLKNASISYSFPKQLLSGKLQCARIILSANNLFTISSLKSKSIDPEIGSMTSLPLFRTINLGFKLDF